MTPARSAAPKRRAAAPGDPAREAWAMLIALLKAAKSQYLAEFNLTHSQAQLLISIEPGHPAQMGEVANALGCDASNVTGLVDRLEERNLIERRADPADRRVKLIAVTEAGRRLQAKLQEKWFEPPAAIAKLSLRDRTALREILRKAAE